MIKKLQSWDDVSIKMMEEIESLDETLSEEHPLKRKVGRYSVITGIGVDEIMNMPLSESDKIFEEYKWLEKPPKGRKIENWEGARVVYDINKASLGQFIDMDTVNKEANASLQRRLAILWDKDMPLDEREKFVYENMPITIALGVNNFFLPRLKVLQRFLPKYLVLLTMIEGISAKIHRAIIRPFTGLFGFGSSRKR